MGSAELPGFQPDRDFWFEDGTVTIVAQTSGFRIYKGILSRESEVFRDLFTVPQPTYADGECPVIHVSDSAHDFKQFLNAVLDARREFRADKAVPFSTVAAVIRIAHKYQVTDLLKDALDRLKTYFTSDFFKWDDLEAFRPVAIEAADCIEAIGLAYLTGSESMLPTAFYCCCQLDVELVRGVARADGTLERLCPDDVARCLVAQRQFMQASARSAFRIFMWDVAEDCASPARCEGVFRDMMRRLEKHSGDVAAYHALDSWYAWIRPQYPLCAACVAMFERRDVEERRKTWVRLPEILKLDVAEWEKVEPESAE